MPRMMLRVDDQYWMPANLRAPLPVVLHNSYPRNQTTLTQGTPVWVSRAHPRRYLVQAQDPDEVVVYEADYSWLENTDLIRIRTTTRS